MDAMVTVVCLGLVVIAALAVLWAVFSEEIIYCATWLRARLRARPPEYQVRFDIDPLSPESFVDAVETPREEGRHG